MHSSSPLRRPRRGLETFPAPAPTPSFPVGASWPRSQVSARSYPNSLLSQPSPRSSPSGSEKPRGNLGAESRARSFGNPSVRARQGLTGDASGSCCLSLPARLRGCPGAAGLSRRCLPTQLPMLASQPVPMHRRRRTAGYSSLLPRTAASPGQRLPQPDIESSWISPGARAAQRRLRHKLCGPGEREVARPGGPATVPDQRPVDWRGGGRGRTPPQLLLARSRLPAGAGPPESVSHLPNPAPAQPRSLPPSRDAGASAAGRPRCACDLTAPPLGPGLVFSLASPWVRTAPRPHPARCPPCRLSPRESGRELCALNRPGCVPSRRFPSSCRAPAQAPPSWGRSR